MTAENQLPALSTYWATSLPDCSMHRREANFTKRNRFEAADAAKAAIGSLMSLGLQPIAEGTLMDWGALPINATAVLDLQYKTNDPVFDTVNTAFSDGPEDAELPAAQLFLRNWRQHGERPILHPVQFSTFDPTTGTYDIRHINLAVNSLSKTCVKSGIDLDLWTQADGKSFAKLMDSTTFRLPLIIGAPYNFPAHASFRTIIRLRSAGIIVNGNEKISDDPRVIAYANAV